MMYFFLYFSQIYYASVRATTADGSTVVSSDGVTIVPVNTPLWGATVLDATPCASCKLPFCKLINGS